MKDTFFIAKNCSRCGEFHTVFTMSFFTEDTICIECSEKEDKIKKSLKEKGMSTLEGCGYIPVV